LRFPVSNDGIAIVDMTRMPFVILFAAAVGLSAAETPRPVGEQQRAPCTAPSPGGREGHAMTYDSVGRRVLLFGGTSSDSADQWPRSLWAWDGTRWSCIDADGPAGRDSPEMAYDARRNRLVLYGGRTSENRQGWKVLTETWEWDGARWTMVDSVGLGPRVHTMLAYDAERGAVIAHGGIQRGHPMHRDTWRWDGTAWRATDIAIGPIGDHHNGLVPTTSGVLLSVSVQDSAGGCLAQPRLARGRPHTYLLRGLQWAPAGPPGPCVGGGGIFGVVWTPEGTLLYSGWSGGPQPRAESWILRGETWQSIDSIPTPRRGARVAPESFLVLQHVRLMDRQAPI
jgi:hypothetical protein